MMDRNSGAAGARNNPRRDFAAAPTRSTPTREAIDGQLAPSRPGRGAQIAIVLMDAGTAVETPAGVVTKRPGAGLREIAVAVPGSWVRGDQSFSITKEDLRDMVRNFNKRKNDMVVIDYEHASEQPEVARGGPVPGAGWIHALHSNGKLTALVEWTPQAEEMLCTGQYRFFSPAIDWGATDKGSGEPQGATLTSGALTNHPFLEELPPITLSDGKIVTVGLNRAQVRSVNTARKPQGAMNMKKMTLKPIPEGEEHGGNHAVYDADAEQPVGFIPHSELSEYAAHHLGVNPDLEEDDTESESDEDTTQHPDLKIAAREAQRKAFFMREAVHRGKIDIARATRLAETGKITLAEYIRAQEAEKLIADAIAAGKVLPRDRAFFFRDALERPKEFQEYARNAAPAVRLDTQGIAAAEGLTVDQEVHLGAKRLMSDTGMNYAKALKELLSSNPALEAKYRLKHTRSQEAETATQ
ncbi:MAG: phage protease [Terriglobia bacterium]